MELTALGVDIFAGGFTVGVSKHFDVLGHLEEGDYGVESAKLNFPHMPIVVGQQNWEPFLKDLVQRRGRPNLVYCNPPCAMFSVIGATLRGGGDAWRNDPRQNCWRACFSVFEQLLPDFYVVESVTRAFSAGREFVQEFVDRGRELGYSATHLLLDTQYLGLPQIRKRYHLVLHKPRFDVLRPNWSPPKTAAEALAEVSDPGYVEVLRDPVQAKLLTEMAQGEAMRPKWEQMMRETVGPEETWPRSSNGVAGRPRMLMHRCKADSPIGTVTGAYFIHPTEDRMLGTRELQYLTGYPQDYKFESHGRYHPSLIARGVTPCAGEFIARNIASSLRRWEDLDGPREEIVDLRTPPPGVLEELKPKRKARDAAETELVN